MVVWKQFIPPLFFTSVNLAGEAAADARSHKGQYKLRTYMDAVKRHPLRELRRPCFRSSDSPFPDLGETMLFHEASRARQ
jgi:hypothetical protein